MFYVELFSIEIRKSFAYRADFWGNFVMSVLLRMIMAYFVWNAVYEASGNTIIGGFTERQMHLYTYLAFLVDLIVRSAVMKDGILAREIYDGSLTRYLIYPVNVFTYKVVIMFTQMFLGLIQFMIGLGAYLAIFGWPEGIQLQTSNVILGLIYLIPAALVFFVIGFTIQLVAFWADNVWSLMVMLKFISAFLGGAFIPVHLFPVALKAVVDVLPFYGILGFPTMLMLGRASATEALHQVSILLVWGCLSGLVLRSVWKRGLKQYTGVGM